MGTYVSDISAQPARPAAAVSAAGTVAAPPESSTASPAIAPAGGST
jgi:hypothetical protein